MTRLTNQKILLILIFLGFFLRFFLLPFPGHEHDMAFWKGWSLYGADKGPVELVQSGNYYNYPSFFALFMFLIGKIFALFGHPYDIASYWSTTNLGYLILFKIWAIAGDALVAWLIYKICQVKVGPKKALWLSLLFFLSPLALFDGAFWGQVDGLGFLFLISAIYLLERQKPELASFIFVLGVFFKLQNIVFAPLILGYLFLFGDLVTFGKSLGFAFLAMVLGNLPYLAKGKAELIFSAFNKNIDYYPYFTLKANNFWALLTKDGYWENYPDQTLLLGISSAKSLGMAAFVVCYLIATLLILRAKKQPTRDVKSGLAGLILGCSLASISFFTVLTQMHDRYLYSFFPLLLLYFAFQPSGWPFFKLFAVGWTLIAFNYFISLLASFSFQYQYLGINKLASFLNSRDFTWFNSGLNTLVFLALLIYGLSRLPKALRLTPLLFPALILIQNLAYLRQQPIPGSKFLASNWKQSWGQPQKNRSVNSFLGAQNWSRLSNNYYFFEQGIGVHAFSEIYLWPNQKLTSLETDYGLETEATEGAKVNFEVVGDDQILFSSPPMTKADLPRHLKLNIKGLKRLVLKVNDGGDGINGDHASWFNLVFYR